MAISEYKMQFDTPSQKKVSLETMISLVASVLIWKKSQHFVILPTSRQQINKYK